jgi:hypothetical protein
MSLRHLLHLLPRKTWKKRFDKIFNKFDSLAQKTINFNINHIHIPPYGVVRSCEIDKYHARFKFALETSFYMVMSAPKLVQHGCNFYEYLPATQE